MTMNGNMGTTSLFVMQAMNSWKFFISELKEERASRWFMSLLQRRIIRKWQRWGHGVAHARAMRELRAAGLQSEAWHLWVVRAQQSRTMSNLCGVIENSANQHLRARCFLDWVDRYRLADIIRRLQLGWAFRSWKRSAADVVAFQKQTSVSCRAVAKGVLQRNLMAWRAHVVGVLRSRKAALDRQAKFDRLQHRMRQAVLASLKEAFGAWKKYISTRRRERLLMHEFIRRRQLASALRKWTSTLYVFSFGYSS